MEQVRLPIKRAIFLILASVVLVWGCVLGAYLVWGEIKKSRMQDAEYSIVAIQQKTHSQDTLPTVYFAELLNLSQDKPTNMYAFSSKKAEEILLSYHFLKQVKVGVKRPGVVTVEYEMRTPYAQVADFENMAISEDLYLFPLAPFYTPKRLPEIVIGKIENGVLDSERTTLAFSLIEEAKKFPPQFFLARVDVRQSTSVSKCREIIVVLEENDFQKMSCVQNRYILRLPRREYKKALSHFFDILPSIKVMKGDGSAIIHDQVVDMRVDHIALVKR